MNNEITDDQLDQVSGGQASSFYASASAPAPAFVTAALSMSMYLPTVPAVVSHVPGTLPANVKI